MEDVNQCPDWLKISIIAKKNLEHLLNKKLYERLGC